MTTRLIAFLETHVAKTAWLGGMLLLAWGLVLSRGGMLHPEAESFLPHYLEPSRSPASLVLDPAANDFGMYQARELSYLIDWLDCRFMAFCAKHGTPHFLSLSHFVFALAGAVLLWGLAVRLGLSRAAGAVLALLFLSTPMVLLGGDYFRSAKSGATLALLASVFLYAGLAHPARSGRGLFVARLTGFGCAVLLCGLFDRQGVFFGLIACILQGLRVLARPTRQEFAILATLAGAAGLLVANNRLIAPALIDWTNGYRPTRDFQNFLPGNLVEWRASASLVFFHGPVLALKYAGAALGALPWPLIGLGVLGHATKVLADGSSESGNRARIVGLWPFWLTLLLMTMTALMALRIPSLLLPELTAHYYSLPTAAIGCVVLAALAAGWPVETRRFALVVGLALTAANLLQLHDHRQRQHRGIYAAAYDRAPHLLAALHAAPSSGTAKERNGAVAAALPANTGPAATAAVLALLGTDKEPSTP